MTHYLELVPPPGGLTEAEAGLLFVVVIGIAGGCATDSFIMSERMRLEPIEIITLSRNAKRLNAWWMVQRHRFFTPRIS